MHGYKCTMVTDTEVIAYAVDLLMRRQHLPIELLVKVFASPLWNEIDSMEPKQAELMRMLRQTYGSLLMNGPFSIVIAHHGEMIGLTDRIKLRPMVAGQKGDVHLHFLRRSSYATGFPSTGSVLVSTRRRTRNCPTKEPENRRTLT